MRIIHDGHNVIYIYLNVKNFVKRFDPKMYYTHVLRTCGFELKKKIGLINHIFNLPGS